MIEYYTYDMGVGEASDKDSISSLFEPMPLEALEPNPDLPANVPLSDSERRETVDWLLSPSGGNVNIKLRKPYNTAEIRESLIEAMLLNSWFLPDNTLGNKIPLQAQSAHKVGSTTIPLTLSEDFPKRIDIVAKPFHQKNSKAEDELDKLEKAFQRGIRVVEPLGTIDINDLQGHDTYVLTILKKGILPLEKIHFEQLNLDSQEKFKQLKDFMKSLGGFIATMHNQGIVHGDLHIGNIAYDLNQEDSREFVIFDFERATVMASDKLGLKNMAATPTESYMRKFRAFESETIEDIANLAADITVKNERVSSDTILLYLVIPYLRARKKSHGQYTEEEFLRIYNTIFKKKLKTIREIVDVRRRKLIELAGSDKNKIESQSDLSELS